jgi:hypothetical protein
MDKIINILLICTFVSTFVDYVIPILGYRFDRKPLNCSFCLSFWISLIVAIVSGHNYLMIAPLLLRIIERKLL